MGKLTTVREDRSEGSTSMNTPLPPGFEPNRVDTIIADVFSLISLMFLTVGKSRESPAIYGQIASMRVCHRCLSHAICIVYVRLRSPQQILTHLDESGIYTEAYLQGFKDRIDQLREIIKNDRDEQRHPEAVLKYMSWKLDGNGASLRDRSRILMFSEAILKNLMESLGVLNVELVPIHNRLVLLRKQLIALASQPKVNKAEFKPIVEELRKIDS